MKNLIFACQTALTRNLAVTAGERVLILTDGKKRSIGKTFEAAAGDLTENVELTEVLDKEFNGNEPPDWVAEKMSGADVIPGPEPVHKPPNKVPGWQPCPG